MSITLKLMILGAILLGDVVAGALIAGRLLAQGRFPQAVILVGGLAMGWAVLAIVLFAFV